MLISGPLYAQSPDNSPLNPDEGRLILGQLNELDSCRDESTALQDYVERDREQDAREKASYERALEIEQRATSIAEQERDLAREKAALYEDLYRAVTKKPGIGCRILRVFTLGIHRCR